MRTNGKDRKVPHAHVFEKDGHKYIRSAHKSLRSGVSELELHVFLLGVVLLKVLFTLLKLKHGPHLWFISSEVSSCI